MKTYSTKLSDIKRDWHVLDATGRPLGRLASEVAQILKGKHKPIYAPHLDTGDNVIVINAKRVKVTGKKVQTKLYYRHSGYPGGLRAVSYAEMLDRFPDRVIKHAVKGMLPHNTLGRKMLARLKVYAGDVHPHEAQIGTRRGSEDEESRPKAPAKASKAVQEKGG